MKSSKRQKNNFCAVWVAYVWTDQLAVRRDPRRRRGERAALRGPSDIPRETRGRWKLHLLREQRGGQCQPHPYSHCAKYASWSLVVVAILSRSADFGVNKISVSVAESKNS